MAPHEDARSLLCRAALLAGTAGLALALSAPAQAASTFTLKGRGFGHGIGMSQYGAYGYAKHGRDYRFILGHYYLHTRVRKLGGRTVRVLLQANRASVSFTGATQASGTPLAPGTRYTVRRSGSRLALSGGGKRVGVFRAPLRTTGNGPLRLLGGALNGVGSGRYRGDLQFRPGLAGGVNAVNAVPVEAYVQGVVPSESPAEWPLEALKAQAVAARSYAATANVNGNGFDQYPDTRSQVYSGVNGEVRRATRAVRATAGEYVTYRGKPAETFFFSTSGGHTENIEYSFIGANPLPYLKGVEDPYDATSPYHAWGPIRYRASRLGTRLGARGSLRGVEVLKRGSSPRIVRARILGSGGNTTLTGPQIRARLGLRDTWIAIRRVDASATDPGALQGMTPGPGLAPAAALRRVEGTVDPYPEGATVELQRRARGRWARAARTPAAAGGAYAFTPSAPGTYRVLAGWASGPVLRVR